MAVSVKMMLCDTLIILLVVRVEAARYQVVPVCFQYRSLVENHNCSPQLSNPGVSASLGTARMDDYVDAEKILSCLL